MLPAFITFTGVDSNTNVDDLLALAADYPVEFGVLFSPIRQGVKRFPHAEFIRNLVSRSNGRLMLAAHLCDAYSEALIAGRPSGLEAGGLLAGFARVQVNGEATGASASIRRWADALGGKTVILQCRESFPHDDRVRWLFDPSSGTGTSPARWPAAPGIEEAGYAGGINLGNVQSVVGQLGTLAGRYWIDMASGARDDRGNFDVGVCRRICEAVYGRPTNAIG